MADDKKQVNVDFSNHPELYQKLDDAVKKLDTDRSKLVRKLIREGLEQLEQSPTKDKKTRNETYAA